MPEGLRPIRILLVDDHALFREGVARFLLAEADFEVVGGCGSIDDALALVERVPVDVVLLDFDLGGRDGTQFMRRAGERGFAGKVLVVTAGVSDQDAADLIAMGVAGIVRKHHPGSVLVQGIRDVIGGKVWFDPQLLKNVAAIGAASRGTGCGPFTRRESQVLTAVLEGLANKQIAGRIGVSESAVKATLQQLFSKTGVRTRSQLVRIALERYPELATEAPRQAELGPKRC